MTPDQVRYLLLKRAAKYVGKRKDANGMLRWSKEHGVSRGHVGDFLAGRRLPTTAILDALNLE